MTSAACSSPRRCLFSWTYQANYIHHNLSPQDLQVRKLQPLLF
ncbi:hypothetical protein Goklo_019183 [Gossypium klotzschianum]|uniref:Uncharacterized protein n=1 Tax=Gossypium klotzschianum TaxID=34286 RepID=A0A7J8UN06_9ROSI|nr:hypothetical protein [Gossypium klotzschianum]